MLYSNSYRIFEQGYVHPVRLRPYRGDRFFYSAELMKILSKQGAKKMHTPPSSIRHESKLPECRNHIVKPEPGQTLSGK